MRRLLGDATRRAALLCGLVAFLHGAAWGLLQPPFQGPDEPAHFAYAQHIADTGSLKRERDNPEGAGGYARHTDLLLNYLPFSVEGPPTWSPRLVDAYERRLAETPNVRGDGSAAAIGLPPLYYLLEAPVAAVTRGWDPRASLVAARLVSALFNALTAIFIFLFLRELMPSHRWAWSLGSLAVALHPLFGFMGGSVNPDSLLFATSAALFWLAARTIRAGLTMRRALAIAGIAVLGCLTKGTTYALLPGLTAAAAVGGWRARRAGIPLREILVRMGAGLALFVAGFGGYIWANAHLLAQSPATAGAFVTSSAANDATTVGGQLSYTWQFFFPRLWEMQDQFPGYPSYPLWDFYVKGFVGRFGWFQYDFPPWVQWTGLLVLLALIAAAAVALAPRLRRRGPLRVELAIYAVTAVAVLLAVSVAGYRYTAVNKLDFEQTRYIFPLLPLYGALVPTAALAAGRRWSPLAGGVLLVLLSFHGLAGQLLVLQRYYT